MTVKVTLEWYSKVDAQLEQIPIELRGKALKSGLRKAGQQVVKRAKQLVPGPGYPGDKPALKPLRETLRTEVKEYANAIVAISGPKWPEGAHGHLVEESHQHFSHGKATGVMTEAQPFIEPAAKDTRELQDKSVRDGVAKAIKKALK